MSERQKIACFVRRPQQSGAALITAILITALAASAAMLLLGRIDHWIERVALTRDKAQALELARAGVDYARLVLAADARLSPMDTLDEDWARQLPPMRHEASELSGHIEDLQGRFNLNNLRRSDGVIDEQAFAAYQRLLALLDLPEALADTLADWLDGDDSPRAAGAESTYYQGLAPALQSANRPLDHLNNLLRIKGYTPRTLAQLAAFVAALPEQQAINVNTASAEVLAAIQPGLGLAAAKALVQTRQAMYFRDVADFQNRLPAKNLPAALLPIATASHYFLIHMQVDTGTSRSRVRALVNRTPDTTHPQILWLGMQ